MLCSPCLACLQKCLFRVSRVSEVSGVLCYSCLACLQKCLFPVSSVSEVSGVLCFSCLACKSVFSRFSGVLCNLRRALLRSRGCSALHALWACGTGARTRSRIGKGSETTVGKGAHASTNKPSPRLLNPRIYARVHTSVEIESKSVEEHHPA